MKTRRMLLVAIAAVASAMAFAGQASAQACEGTVTDHGTCEFFASGSCPPGSTQIGPFSDGTKICERPL